MNELAPESSGSPYEGLCFYCQVNDATWVKKVVVSRERINPVDLNPRYRIKTVEMPICSWCLRRVSINNALGAALAICGILIWVVERILFYAGDILTWVLALVGGGAVLAGGFLAIQNLFIDNRAKDMYQICLEKDPQSVPKTHETILK